MDPIDLMADTEEFIRQTRIWKFFRFISCALKLEQNITQAQRNAIHALKSNRNIVIKPTDKGGAIIVQNKMDNCKEAYLQLNNQERYRQLPTDPTKEHSHQLRLIKTSDQDLQ
eukprot:g44256.t1